MSGSFVRIIDGTGRGVMRDVAAGRSRGMLTDDPFPNPTPGVPVTSAREPADLSRIDLAACRARVGEEFRLRADVDPPFVLRLEEAVPTRRDPAEESADGRPFSLLFRGPAVPVLRQGMHDLENAVLTLPGVFLVPLAPDGEGQLYEAVFT